MSEDKIRLALNRLENLTWEIAKEERRMAGLVNLKISVLDDLRRFGLKEFSDFKSYLDRNPDATPIRQLPRRIRLNTSNFTPASG